jgi:23S rRNA (pseudouridine1915-N3)-methyltransferase
MKIELWWVGKTSDKYLEEGILNYFKRIKKHTSFSLAEIRTKKTKNKSDQIDYEGSQIIQKIKAQDYVILLDERGNSKSSIELARYLEKISIQSHKRVIFIIGGAYGFSEAVREKSHYSLSLSAMTFPHDLVRVLFLEQLYRAFTITNGLPYHHS